MQDVLEGFKFMPIRRVCDTDPYLSRFGDRLVEKFNIYTLGELMQHTEEQIFSVKTTPRNRERFKELVEGMGFEFTH